MNLFSRLHPRVLTTGLMAMGFLVFPGQPAAKDLVNINFYRVLEMAEHIVKAEVVSVDAKGVPAVRVLKTFKGPLKKSQEIHVNMATNSPTGDLFYFLLEETAREGEAFALVYQRGFMTVVEKDGTAYAQIPRDIDFDHDLWSVFDLGEAYTPSEFVKAYDLELYFEEAMTH